MSGEGSEEAPCCRVCHGESEPDNQLFFPCKCSGSIKYVHQECLVQWLKVSGKENPKCELCGEPFHFQKVYKNDTPFQIAVLDVALELVPKAWSLLYYAIVTGLAMILWVIVLPLFTNWWVKVCWCFVTSSSGYCLSSLPTFAVTGSVEGFVTFWYFGLVDVCIILATSVVSYEVGHMIYKEYQAVGNAKRIRVLERRLATNIANMQRYEEESLRRERTIFAVSDYESMKYEWDLAKKGMEENIHIEPPSTLGTSGTNSTTAAEPSIEDRFRMVQSLVNDERYCAKVVQRLDVVCELAQQDAPGFAAIRGSYQKLHTDLVSTNKQCAELVNLLPSAINPHHPSYRGHQESSSLAQSEHGGDIYSLSPISSAVAGAAGVASEVSGGEGGEREEEEKVPWFEQDTGLRLEDIEPTMDNLELRVNLLMRRKLQEEAAAGRLLMTQQQQQSTEAATLVAMSSSWNNAERNSSIHEIVQNTAAGYEDQEVEYGADCDVMLAAVASAADSMSHGEYQQVEKGREFNLVERALHSEHEGQVEAEQQALCEQQHRNHSSTRWADSPNDYDADVDDEQSCRDLFQQGYEEGIGEVYGDYGEAEGDGVEHRSDIEEVWNALETIITDIELNSCEVYMYGEDDADNNAFDDEGEVEGMGQQLDRDVSSAAENDSGGAAAQPLLAPLQVEVPPIPPADGALPDRIEEVQVVEGPELPAVVPRPGGVEARNRNQNNNNVHNDPFLNFNTIAVAYLYVIVFVLGALLVPSYLGGVFLAHTSLGSRLTEAVRAHVMEMLSSEENYQALLRFLDYLTFSVEDIEAQEDKAVAAALVLANLHAAVNLMAGYAFYISIPFFLFCVCYLQYATDFATNENMVSLTATVTRQVNNIQDYAHTAAKMAFVGTVQGVVVPALFALLTVKFIDRSLPMYMRYNALDTSANFAVWLILFVFAHLFIVHIRQVTFEARVAIDPKYLVGILPDTPVLGPRQEPLVVAALHEKLRHTSYLQLLKSTLIRVCILLPSFIAAVIVPIRLGHLLCPLAEPLLFRMHFQKQVKVDAQIPVEMILWHILLPFVIEKMRYVSVVQQVVSTFLFVAAPALGLDWLLVAPPAVVREPVNALPPVADAVVAANGEEDATAETVNAAVAPPAVNSGNSSWPLWVRASALIALTMFSLALLSSWVLHAPLVVGRWVMEGLALSPHNDLYNYPIGMLLCWGFCFVVQYIIKDAARNTGAVSTVKATLKWLAVAGKVVGVGALWLGLPPFLLGVLIEALVIVPLRMNPFETSHFPYLQNWALGLIILKAITKCVLSGLFGDIALRTDLEMLLIRGFEQFDAMHAVSTILLPVCVILLDFLLVPHFLARAACVLVPSYLARTLMMRFCYHAYIMIRIAVYVAYRVAVTLVKLHNEVRDSKYLIGTRLTNRGQLA